MPEFCLSVAHEDVRLRQEVTDEQWNAGKESGVGEYDRLSLQ